MTDSWFRFAEMLDRIDILEADNELLARKLRDTESELRQAICQRDIARQDRDKARMEVDSWKLAP